MDRHDALATLAAALDAANAGQGQLVSVRGAAGIGKTAVINHFLAGLEPGIRWLRGSCDDLVTPRPLGPFFDIGRQVGGDLQEAIQDGAAREHVLRALLDQVARLPPPVVLVIEDLHWADEATLDLVMSLSRRIADRALLLVLSHRPDEVDTADGLLRMLASAPPGSVRHVDLPPLSLESVTALAEDSDIDPADLHLVTAGNAFFVTELLASGQLGPTPSVAAAVAARVAQLPEDTRVLLELVSVLPGRVETAVLDELEPEWPAILEPAERRGMVTLVGDTVAFRHELARVSLEQALPRMTARRLHAQVLRVLETSATDPARLVHHADLAGDDEAVVAHAPVAARAARAAESHREAVAHFKRALRHEERYPADERARMYIELARSSMASDDPPTALTAARRGVELARMTGDDVRTGEALSSLSRIESWTSHLERAAAAADEAVALLEPAGPSDCLAWAYAARCYVALTAWDGPGTHEWANKCIATADAVGDARTRVLGEVYLRTTELSETGRDEPLAAAIATANQLGQRETVSQGYVGAVTALYFRKEHARADRWCDEALAHCEDHEQFAWAAYFHALRAGIRLATGDWRRVEDEVEAAVTRHQQPVWAACVAATARGRLWARTGHRGARDELDRAWKMANELGVPQARFEVAVALAELDWLAGQSDGVRDELALVRSEAARLGWKGMIGEVEFWAARFGAETADLGAATGPFGLLVQGRHLDAAQAWDRLGCPYERAECLVLSEDPTHILEGLAVLDRLGAIPLAGVARTRLRTLGVSVPRGPRADTRSNVAGLTARQTEVLALLRQDLTNAQIAERLVVSRRTVDHHVSAILAKLGAPTRQEAVAMAAELEKS